MKNFIDKIKTIFVKDDVESTPKNSKDDLQKIVDSKKGVKKEYLVKECIDCKEEKIIHSFAERCLDCRKIHSNKYVKTYTFNCTEIVAVRPYDHIMCEAPTRDKLLLKLEEEFNIKVPKYQTAKGMCKYLKDGVRYYWSWKGLIILHKKFYNDKTLEDIFLESIDKQAERKKYTRKVSDKTKLLIAKILDLKSNRKKDKDIAKMVGTSRSYISKVLSGEIYSEITGIVYKRKYNTYTEDGEVLVPKEVKASKIMK